MSRVDIPAVQIGDFKDAEKCYCESITKENNLSFFFARKTIQAKNQNNSEKNLIKNMLPFTWQREL